jgi:uncharacterized protein YjiS (DUF1127 family)
MVQEKTMSLINLFVSARDAFARWRQRQRAYGELMALDDRSLADIGIRRSEIASIVWEHELARHDEAPVAGVFSPARLATPHRWLPPL